jgi:DNA segregation ATPase FtsK/SpoIIIE-like protein
VLKKLYQKIIGGVLICISTGFLVSIIFYNAGDYASLINNLPVHNPAGPIGAWTAFILRSAFGMASYMFIAMLLVPGVFLVNNEWMHGASEKSIALLVFTVSASAIASLLTGDIPQLSGGYVGHSIAYLCGVLISKTTSIIILTGINLLCIATLIIMFIPSGNERSDFPSGFFGSLQLIFNNISRARKSRIFPAIPLKEKYSGSVRKYPWITKKRILVFETEKPDVPLEIFRDSRLIDSSGNGERRLLDDRYSIDAVPVQNFKLDDGDYHDVDPENIHLGNGYNIENNVDLDDRENITGALSDISDGVDSTGEALSSKDINIDDDDREEDERVFRPSQDRDSDAMRVEKYTEKIFEKIPINEEYIIPTTYLNSAKPVDSESWKNEVRRNSALLKKMLAEFGIDSDVVNVNRGPVITLYEMQIAPGIKVNRIVSLADDIAMALAAHRVRIVAPIPGKSAIGVEIPNRYRETVTLGDIIKSDEFHAYKGSLVIVLGKDILGNPVMQDLKRLPHLLIAGATGSGKSVCVNAIITSLLYNYDPNYVRFILIDPKMVELQFYNGLPHLLTPVIVDPHMAPVVLKWMLHEMERRYVLLSEMNTRDVERYNEKIERFGGSVEKLPFIVTIIDEMADLIMTSKEVEGYITRIAQKARAVGIHLVVATQRPSVDIITGIIKANFPARIAFQVAQKTDSRTIIDQNGAEKLLGRGDMLYQPPTSSFPIRVQGGFISEEEIEKVVSHLQKLGKASYIDIEEDLFEDEESKEMDETSDELFQEALKIVDETRKASASYLQRRLSIGYNRAARIIEQMEEMGYIGPQIGSKPREVLI